MHGDGYRANEKTGVESELGNSAKAKEEAYCMRTSSNRSMELRKGEEVAIRVPRNGECAHARVSTFW